MELITSILALIIGFVVGLLTRQTEFKKFLLQKRIDMFTAFLEDAEICRRKAISSIVQTQINKDNFNSNDLPHIITTIYKPFILKKQAIALILQKTLRVEFNNIIKNISALTLISHMSDPKDVETNKIEIQFKNLEKLFQISIDHTISFIQLNNQLETQLKEIRENNNPSSKQ